MTSFDSAAGQNANYPTYSLPPGEAQPLSDAADDSCQMTDGERELRIALAGSMVEHHMAEWEAHSNLDDLAKARVARLRMEALEAGRPTKVVA